MCFDRLLDVAAACLMLTALCGVSQNASSFTARTPLAFEPNLGQSETKATFLANHQSYRIAIDETSVAYLFPPALNIHRMVVSPTLKLRWSGDHSSAQWRTGEPLPGKSNYFRGSDPSRWIRNATHYAELTEVNAIPGVDIRYYRTPQNDLEYDLRISPSVDVASVRFSVEGADEVRLCEQSALCISIGRRQIRYLAPSAFQMQAGKRVIAHASYVLNGRGEISFAVLDRIPGAELIIDPVLMYSTFLSGSLVVDEDNCGPGYNQAQGVAVDPAGNFYVTGVTDAFDFPVTPTAFQKSGVSSFECLATPMDGFVTKFSKSGQLLYSTYLSGDQGIAVPMLSSTIAVDGNGNAYVIGTAYEGFPTTAGAYQRTCAKGDNTPCAFLARIDAAGSDLVYATYLGGWHNAQYSRTTGTGLALGRNGSVFLVGRTTDTTFPATSSAYGQHCTPGASGYASCGFAARFDTNAAGSASLVFSTLIGQDTTADAVAVDKYGDAYVVGTSNADLPHIAAFGTGPGPVFNSFLFPFFSKSSYVLKLNGSNGSARRPATVLRGATPTAVAVDGLLNTFVAGGAMGGMATTSGALQTAFRGGDMDGFVTKISASGYRLMFSTYLGGSKSDYISSLAVNANGIPFMAGTTWSSNFPIRSGAFKATFPLLYDFSHSGFVTALNANGKGLYYSSFLGGRTYTEAYGLAIDSGWNAYVCGSTADSDFPVTPSAFQTSNSTNWNAFVSRVEIAGDLRVTVKTSANPGWPSWVPQNTTVIYNVRVYNAGPDGSDNVLFTDSVPVGMAYAGVYMPDGTVCSQPTYGSTSGTLSCRKTRLERGQTWYVNVYLRAVGASGTNTANVMNATPQTPDLWPSNNSAYAVVAIQ